MNNITETKNVSSSNNNTLTNNNMYRDNIIINVVLGIIALIIFVYLIVLIYNRFFKKPVPVSVPVHIISTDSVSRVPNPLYESTNNNDIMRTESSV